MPPTPLLTFSPSPQVVDGCVIRLRLEDAPVVTTSNKLYVGQLAWECAWQDLKDHFKAIGPVSRADVATDHNGRSRGFGFVEFENPADAGMLYGYGNGYEYGCGYDMVTIHTFTICHTHHTQYAYTYTVSLDPSHPITISSEASHTIMYTYCPPLDSDPNLSPHS